VEHELPEATPTIPLTSAIKKHKVQLLKLKCWCHIQKHIFLRILV